MNTTQTMNHIKSSLAIAAIVATALPVLAQRPRTSPHETTSAVIDGNRVTIVYGRPYTKSPRGGENRKIWGELVPFGKVWRTGADEATLLITEKPIVMNGTKIPAGAYTLFTLPADADSAKLIVNKQLGQWGLTYKEDQDVARIDLKKGTLEKPVTQFTMAVAKNPAGGGVLKLMWEETEFDMPFTVEK
jgi:hypothetical protein